MSRIIFGFPKRRDVRSGRWQNKIAPISEIDIFELLKLLSKVVREENSSEKTNAFLTNWEIEISLDEAGPIKTILFNVKLTKIIKKRVSVRIQFFYNTLTKLDIKTNKNIKDCEKNYLNKMLHYFNNYYWFCFFLKNYFGFIKRKKRKHVHLQNFHLFFRFLATNCISIIDLSFLMETFFFLPISLATRFYVKILIKNYFHLV